MSNWWKIIHSTPHAISQYKSQAKRAQKAAGLTVIKISDNHWKVGKWDVTGEAKSCISSNNSLQCNCPDRTSEEPPRSWVGSGAGGFNPCKHVYAVLLKEEKNIGKKKAKVTLPDGRIFVYEDTPIQIDCFKKWGEDCEDLILNLNDGQNSIWNNGWNFYSQWLKGPIYNWETQGRGLYVLCRGIYGCGELKYYGVAQMYWDPIPGMQRIFSVSTGMIESEARLKIYGASGNTLFDESVENCGYNVECILS